MQDLSQWPPPGEPMRTSELPTPATALWRLSMARTVFLVLLPVLLTAQAGRLARSGVPPSRLLNPGVLVVVVLATVAMALAVLPARRRLVVAGGSGWVARRILPLGRWRVVQLADVMSYSVTRMYNRGFVSMAFVLVERSGRRTSVSLPVNHPGVPALTTALDRAGAQQSPRRLRSMSPLTTGAAVLAIIAIALVPMALVEIGPFRLLPDALAGEFSSSGCRASLAAERSAATAPAVFLKAAEPVGSATWRLRGDWPQDVRTFAATTSDPAARERELTADGAVSVDHVEYSGPTGAVLIVTAVHFSTAAGALTYDHYVNRAVCERFGGAPGPAPTEVRLGTGGQALARWVGGRSLYDVAPAAALPRATSGDVADLAAALTGTGTAPG